MPIVRWHGWAAKCDLCGEFVQISDEVIAFSDREDVIEAVRPADMKCLYRTIKDAIRCLCRCRKFVASKVQR